MKILRQITSIALWVVTGVALIKSGMAAWLMYVSTSMPNGVGGLAAGLMMQMACLLLLVSIAVGFVASKVWTD